MMNRTKENPIAPSVIGPAIKKRKRYVRSLEYELIASLALQQFVDAGQPVFAKLLAIPLTERIPALSHEYGLKRMHQLVKLVLQECCQWMAQSKSKKLTETKISVIACDLLLVAEEDQLSLEDLIVFFELAKEGEWGIFKGNLTHSSLMLLLEQFRQRRYEAYLQYREEKFLEQKSRGPQERISPEPSAIVDLFEAAGASVIPLKKIS
jgi:hypothetical protein